MTLTAEQSAKIFKSVGAGFERLGTGAIAVVLLNQILVDTSGTQSNLELGAQSPQPSVRTDSSVRRQRRESKWLVALRRIDVEQQSDADEPRLVHGDFNSTNILAHKGAVTGILDWEFSHVASPYMDIGNLLRHMDPMYHGEIEAGLVAGGLNVPPDWRRKAELIDLSSHLEFLTTQRSDAFKQRCADWIRDFVERY